MNPIYVIAFLTGFNTIMILYSFFYNNRCLKYCAESFNALQRFADYVSDANRRMERRMVEAVSKNGEASSEIGRQFIELLKFTQTMNAKIGFVAKREIERWKKERSR